MALAASVSPAHQVTHISDWYGHQRVEWLKMPYDPGDPSLKVPQLRGDLRF